MIGADRLRSLVSMTDAIEAMKRAFVGVSTGQLWHPQRLAEPTGTALLMTAADLSASETVVKIVAVRTADDAPTAPVDKLTVRGTVLWLQDAEPVALLDGSVLTALRTGAASGLATDLLAHPNASVLGVIGAGIQAKEQIRGVLAVRAIRTIRIASRTQESARRLAAQLRREHPHVEILAVGTNTDAAIGADVVCCATTSLVPVIHAAALHGRVHVNAVGSFRPDMCELGVDVFQAASTIVVDQVSAAVEEAGDLIAALNSAVCKKSDLVELGELLTTTRSREPAGLSVFKSVGLAGQDWALARLAVKRAQDLRRSPRTAELTGWAT